ncbi:hypothetical protein Tco_0930787 [Tanacetum coccineum]
MPSQPSNFAFHWKSEDCQGGKGFSGVGEGVLSIEGLSYNGVLGVVLLTNTVGPPITNVPETEHVGSNGVQRMSLSFQNSLTNTSFSTRKTQKMFGNRWIEIAKVVSGRIVEQEASNKENNVPDVSTGSQYRSVRHTVAEHESITIYITLKIRETKRWLDFSRANARITSCCRISQEAMDNRL